MQKTIRLMGRVPSKKNNKRRTGKFLINSKAYMDWHKDATKQLDQEKIKPFDHPVTIDYYFYMPDLRVKDISNAIESINDLLVDYGVIPDDSWRRLPDLHPRVVGLDRKDPRTKIVIKSYTGKLLKEEGLMKGPEDIKE